MGKSTKGRQVGLGKDAARRRSIARDGQRVEVGERNLRVTLDEKVVLHLSYLEVLEVLCRHHEFEEGNDVEARHREPVEVDQVLDAFRPSESGEDERGEGVEVFGRVPEEHSEVGQDEDEVRQDSDRVVRELLERVIGLLFVPFRVELHDGVSFFVFQVEVGREVDVHPEGVFAQIWTIDERPREGERGRQGRESERSCKGQDRPFGDQAKISVEERRGDLVELLADEAELVSGPLRGERDAPKACRGVRGREGVSRGQRRGRRPSPKEKATDLDHKDCLATHPGTPRSAIEL